MSGHVFISYARADGRDYAAKLETALQAAGFTTWRDARNLDPHQDFTAEIEQGISEAERVVVCLTPDSKRSDSFVRREIQYAMLCEKKIIPLRFADVLPPIHIIDLTWIDFHKQAWEQAFADLRERLQQPNDAYEVPAAPFDSYREYLKKLYNDIVAYLQQTVFALSSALIELRAESSPDAVQERQALPLAFFGQAGIDTPQNEHKQFNSFHEAFDYYGGRVMLLGDPGAGKTTTLLAFVRDAVAKRLEDPSLPLPITAPISTWSTKIPLEEWLMGQIPLQNYSNLVNLMENGKLLLALDGLNELGDERGGQDLRQQFLSIIPTNNQVIVSCRVEGYDEIRQKAVLAGAITLLPLNDAQMQSYLSQQPDLWVALQADSDLRDIARTPLLLSLFAYAFNGLDEDAKKLHDLSRGDLRDKIFEIYVQRCYEFEGRKRPLLYSLETMKRTFGRAALENLGNVLAITNVLPIDGLGANAVGLLAQGRLLHLLVPVDNAYYRFIHLLLHDYFAFQAGLVALRDSKWYIRANAAEALGWLGDKRANEALLRALNDPEWNVRANATEALGRLGGEHAVEGLLKALRGPEESVVRLRAAVALGSSGDARALEGLIDALLNDPETKVRSSSAEALGNLGDARALEGLLQALLNDPYWEVRRDAAKALGKLRNGRAVAGLLLALRNANFHVQMSAEGALIQIGTPEALAGLEDWRQERRNKSDAQ